MVDSRQKGARAELALKKVLTDSTGLNWQRITQSGALSAVHGLKGDLYVPSQDNVYCIEVKHYAEDQLTSKVLTGKTPKFLEWWEQTLRESAEVDKQPMLIFKFDRSKWFVAVDNGLGLSEHGVPSLNLNLKGHNIFAYALTDVLGYGEIIWVKRG